MKIGIDLSMLVYVGSGVATYSYNLTKALLKYHPEHEYHLFYSSFRRPKNFYYLDELQKLGGHIHSVRLPPRTLKFLWNQHQQLPVEFFTGKVDAFHSSDFLSPPLFKETKGVTTIHDLTWKLFPEYHTSDIVEAHERKMNWTLKNKHSIIVDSENTKTDLLRLYPQAKQSSISVVPLGIDEKFHPITDKDIVKNVLTKYHIDQKEPFLIYIGAIEPRKNLALAVKSFHHLIQKKEFSHYQFIIGGRAGWKNQGLFELIARLELQDKVHFIGFVEDEDLPALYSSAELLLYLSLYEGFGLPPLEAAACGTPFLVFKNSSLKEFYSVELNCCFVDSTIDHQSIAKSIARVLVNRNELTTNLTKMRRKYFWKNSAKKTIAAIKNALRE